MEKAKVTGWGMVLLIALTFLSVGVVFSTCNALIKLSNRNTDKQFNSIRK